MVTNKDEKRKITEEELRSILESYRIDNATGEIVDNNEFPPVEGDDTVPQGQQMQVANPHDNVLPERKSQFEKRNEYLLDFKEDIPQHILDTGLHWVPLSKQNALLNITPKEISRIKIRTRSLYRMISMDRNNRRKFTQADKAAVMEFQERILTKSINGFERNRISTETIETINHDMNVPEKQSQGGIMGFFDKLRGKK